MLKHRNSLQTSLCPVVVCPYCTYVISSESLPGAPVDARGLDLLRRVIERVGVAGEEGQQQAPAPRPGSRSGLDERTA